MTKIAYVVIGMILITVLTVLGISRKQPAMTVSSKPQPVVEQFEPADFEEVKALKIAEMKKEGDFIKVSLKNISDKEINGLTILFKDNSTITTDFTISGDGIIPSGIKELTVPVETENDPITKYVSDQPSFKIAAVVFVDQTGEGDPQYISEIKDRRRGLKVQFEKLLPELNKLPSETETTLLPTLKKTKEKVSVLPKEDEKESTAFQQGLRDGRSDLLELIEAIENDKNQKQSDFVKLHESIIKGVDKIKARIGRL
jgi:hypothetical protein